MGFRLATPPLLAVAMLASVACASCAGLGATSQGPTFESVRQTIERDGARSVEAVLASLPRDYRGHFALMFQSQSAQAAGPSTPRAILYGQDATLVVAFDGASAPGGTSSLETMEFDRARERFVFREIAFRSDGGLPTVSFSEDNPAECAACHGEPAHPLWDGRLRGSYVDSEEVDTAGMPRLRDEYAAFVRGQPDHPRYRYLEGAAPRALGRSERLYQGERGRPALGALLAHWNADAVLRDLVSDPSFDAHAYDLVESLVPRCVQGSSPGPALARFRREAAAWLGVPEARWSLALQPGPGEALPVGEVCLARGDGETGDCPALVLQESDFQSLDPGAT